MQKVHIFTYAHKRPDFIKMQFDSIIKHVKSPYEFIVFNNAIDSIEQYGEIKSITNELGIKCIDIPVDESVLNKLLDGTILNNKYTNPNVACSYPLLWTFEKYLTDEDKICIIDSDMFFINDINFDEMLANNDCIYIPQYRSNNTIKYMWNAFICLNFKLNPTLRQLDWNCGKINNVGVDVGGYIHKYLLTNTVNPIFIEEYSIYDLVETDDGNDVHFILNGNINYSLKLDKELNIISINHTVVDKCYENKSFPHEPEHDDYYNYIGTVTKSIINKLKDNGVNLPNPKHIGFISLMSSQDFFIVHYKSGSNYLNFSTNDYNKIKTEEIKKLL